MWKCLSAEWITRLFDCKDTVEKAFTEIVPRGQLKQQSLSHGFSWWLTSKKKIISQPAKLRALQGLPMEIWGFRAVKKLQNLFLGNYACLVMKQHYAVLHFINLSEKTTLPRPIVEAV